MAAGAAMGPQLAPRPRAGLGLKPQHCATVLDSLPDVGFFEVHAENYMGAGGPRHRDLARVRERYPLSLHGVGLSIGGTEALDEAHLERIRALCARYQPVWFSEHIAWSRRGATFFNDLLPVPYDARTLATVVRHVDRVQEVLRRRILVENPATYLAYAASEMPEAEFLAELTRRSGCGLLLDVANVHVAATNHGYDPRAYIDALPADRIEEIHLAGFAPASDGRKPRLLIDAHDRPVDAAVWALYRHALARHGARPSLVEWDNDVPPFPRLAREAYLADRILAEAAALRVA